MSRPERLVLAEYFATDEVTYVFGARAEWEAPKVAEIRQPLAEIRRFAADHFSLEEDAAGEARRATHSKVRRLDLEEWQHRFAPFIEPVLGWAEPGDYLYLVPHDVLHYLPLHTLEVEGRPLIERNPVLYAPSASVLRYCRGQRKGRRETVLVLGDSDAGRPLAHARAEALQVADLFGTRPYLGEQATKSLVREKLAEERERIDILHFACHGSFHPQQALKSGILLAPEPDQPPAGEGATLEGLPIDRFLTAEDFFHLEMEADLVTLSACESGVNQLRPGDELFGLMRALIYAGTPSVLMSLWAVDEISSGILMQGFYAGLADGRTKAEALQAAQLAVRNMTAAEAITFCEQAIRRLEQAGETQAVRPIRREIAGLCYRARDYAAARAGFEALLAETDPESEELPSLDAAITRCRRLERQGVAADPAVRVFDHIFHWAPFVLVGDWK